MEPLRRLLGNIGKSVGLAPRQLHFDSASRFYLYRYGRHDAFDYQRYREIQIAGNKRKLTKVWAEREVIAAIAGYMQQRLPGLSRGLCHGSRNGAEVGWFREVTGADVIGTDISDTATQFPHLVQWDFHERREDWVGAFDFVYTNSHDHAYDPGKALAAWVEQLRPGGMLIVEHSMGHSLRGASELDPFAVDPQSFPFLVLRFSEGRFAVTRMLELPYRNKPKGIDQAWVFIIERLAT